jgi:ribonuclease Z
LPAPPYVAFTATTRRVLLILLFGSTLLSALVPRSAAQELIGDARTRLILLGTGNPNPDPEHSGPAAAVIVGEQAYLVDAGAGLVRRAAQMSPRYGGDVPALAPRKLTRLFLTHLHSDHTSGLPDIMFTPWVMGREHPLQVYGPEGTERMMSLLGDAYRADIEYRLYGAEPANDSGWRVEAHDVREGVVYRDSLVTVEAFEVPHGTWPSAFAYRFVTADRVIVVSGDTRPSERLVEIARGADILLHEVYYAQGLEERSRAEWRDYHRAHHTSTLELGAIASRAKPTLLVLYHILYWGATDEDLLREIRTAYDGPVEVGHDLGVY